MLHSLTAQN